MRGVGVAVPRLVLVPEELIGLVYQAQLLPHLTQQVRSQSTVPPHLGRLPFRVIPLFLQLFWRLSTGHL